MDLDVEDRVYAITGGSDGLGFALARRLLAEGARVAICGRDPGRLDGARERLAPHDDRVLTVVADVTRDADIDAFLSAALRRWGRLDGLVSSAGRHTGSTFTDITDDDWQADFELKLLAAVRGSRRALPHLAEHGGAVLNVLSIFGRTPGAGSMPSSVFRAAGMALTKAFAAEAAGHGVRSNAVLVGFVESDQWRRLADASGHEIDEFTRGFVDSLGIPLGRQGRAEEFADAAAFLLSPRAGYITGAALAVDGGLSPVI